MREAQVNLAVRWFAGFGLNDRLPDHSSLTHIRHRWGTERFRRIFERTVKACVAAGYACGKRSCPWGWCMRVDLRRGQGLIRWPRRAA